MHTYVIVSDLFCNVAQLYYVHLLGWYNMSVFGQIQLLYGLMITSILIIKYSGRLN